MAPKRSGSSSVTKQQSPAAQLNDRLKKNIPCSFEEWTKGKPDARADCEVQETYAQCIDLLGKLLHLEALLTRKQFRNWVRDVKDVKVGTLSSLLFAPRLDVDSGTILACKGQARITLTASGCDHRDGTPLRACHL